MVKSNKIVIGIDESGRGPLAGPVVASAVFVQGNQCLDVRHLNIGIRDSKKMTAREREKAFEFLRGHPSVEWGIGKVSPKVIDKINILEATKLAMIRAVKNLEKKLSVKTDHDRSSLSGKILLIDGNFGIKLPIKQYSIIKGDAKVSIISMASIIAKVTRDRIMYNYHKKYPDYNFNQHKGYPTKQHYQAILTHGSCPIHRISFRLN